MTLTESVRELGVDIPEGAATGHFRTLCPQCSAKRKKHYITSVSLDITDTGAAGICHHCGWKFALGSLGSSTYKKTYQKPEYSVDEGPLDPGMLQWFAARGITEEVLKRNKVGYKEVWMPQLEGKTKAFAFPYFRDGEVVNVKYRDDRKNFRLEHGAELCLYGLDDVKGDSLVWVEGEIDKLSCEVAGITSCVSVPNGAPGPDAKNVERLFSYLESVDLSAVKKHVIAVDTDEPGRRLKAELVRRLGPEKCYVVEWPTGSKDANETLLKHGAAAIKDLLEHSKAFPIAGIVDPQELEANVMDLYNHGYQKGEQPGSSVLGEHYTVKTGQMTIVTGIPSHGKSSWVDWVMYSLAMNSGWQFAVCSPENQPVEEHLVKFIEMFTGKPFFGYNKASQKEIELAQKWIKDYFTFITPAEEVKDWSIDGVLSMAKSIVLRKGIKGLVLDPWNEFDHQRKSGMNETEHISQCLSKIRRFAQQHGVHVWVVAHPRIMRKSEKSGKYEIPTMYDISGSAHFNNKADFGISVWRDLENPDEPTVIDIQKVRFKRYGKNGRVEMRFDRDTNRYEDYYVRQEEF